MTRLLVVAHAATPGTRAMIFGDAGPVAHPEHIGPLAGATAAWCCGPEPACRVTAQRLGGEAAVVAELAGPGFGAWQGRSLAEVGAEDPVGLRAWLSDPAVTPPGGESLAALLARVGAWADARVWPDGRTVAVVAPLVARALAVHALGAPASVIYRLDVAPLGQVQLTRRSAGWHLRLP